MSHTELDAEVRARIARCLRDIEGMVQRTKADLLRGLTAGPTPRASQPPSADREMGKLRVIRRGGSARRRRVEDSR